MLALLVLPLTEMKPGEMLRHRSNSFVGVSLVLALFRYAEVAENANY